MWRTRSIAVSPLVSATCRVRETHRRQRCSSGDAFVSRRRHPRSLTLPHGAFHAPYLLSTSRQCAQQYRHRGASRVQRRRRQCRGQDPHVAGHEEFAVGEAPASLRSRSSACNRFAPPSRCRRGTSGRAPSRSTDFSPADCRGVSTGSGRSGPIPADADEGLVEVQRARLALGVDAVPVEQAEGRVAGLLDLGKQDAAADRVHGAGRQIDKITYPRRGSFQCKQSATVPFLQGRRAVAAARLPA